MLHLLLLNRDYQLLNYSSSDVWSTQDLWWQNLAHLAPKLPSPIYDDWEQQDPFNILKELINFCSGYSCVSFTVGQNVVFVWKAPSSVADIKGRLDWGEIFGNRMREAWCCPSSPCPVPMILIPSPTILQLPARVSGWDQHFGPTILFLREANIEKKIRIIKA